MKDTPKTAIILGATGLTGGILLEHLLEDPRYKKVVLFSRNPVEIVHPKIESHRGNLLELEAFREKFHGDEVFCCIGTTRIKTPKKKAYRKVDYGIPVAAARLARENGIPAFLVVSSIGANPRSRIFYNRTKGEMEDEVRLMGIERTFILRPSLLAGKRKEKRPAEWLAKQVMNLFNLVLVGPLDKFRPIDPDSIARCMLWLANNPYDQYLIHSDEIRRLALKYKY